MCEVALRATSYMSLVRAQKKVPKGCPNTPPELCIVVTDP